jgi:hypothetical protein
VPIIPDAPLTRTLRPGAGSAGRPDAILLANAVALDGSAIWVPKLGRDGKRQTTKLDLTAAEYILLTATMV